MSEQDDSGSGAQENQALQQENQALPPPDNSWATTEAVRKRLDPADLETKEGRDG